MPLIKASGAKGNDISTLRLRFAAFINPLLGIITNHWNERLHTGHLPFNGQLRNP